MSAPKRRRPVSVADDYLLYAFEQSLAMKVLAGAEFVKG